MFAIPYAYTVTAKYGTPELCIQTVQTTLPIALARPYVEQFVLEGTRVRILPIFGIVLYQS